MNVRRLVTIKTAIFIGLALMISVLFLLARQIKPKPEETPRFGALVAPPLQPIEQLKKPTSQTTSIDEIELPKEARVYRQNPYTLSQDEINSITNNLGFQPGSFQGKLFVAQEGERYLGINPETGVIFVNQPLPDYLKSFNDESLKKFATTFAKPTLSGDKIWENPVMTVSYFKAAGPHDALPVLPSVASSAEVNIFPSLEGWRIVGKKLNPIGDVAPVTVKYFKAQGSVSLRTSVIAVNFAEVGTYPLKSLEMVKQEITNGQPVVSAIIPEGRSIKDIRYGEVLLPTSAQYSDIEVVYYFDPDPNALLQPIYFLTGTTTLEDGTPATIKATLPAIDPQFLKSP